MINVGIVGYGNLGKGVCFAVDKAKDMNLVGIFTRRAPESVKPVIDAKVYSVDQLKEFKGKIDVLLLCGGSATDLPKNTPELLKEMGILKKQLDGVKVLGNGTLDKKLTVQANSFSKSAIEKIENKGGKAEVI